jgi:hypothetical protein
MKNSHKTSSSRFVWALVVLSLSGAGSGIAAFGQEAPSQPGKTDGVDISRLEAPLIAATEISFWLKKYAKTVGEELERPLVPSEGPELVYEKAKRMVKSVGGQFLDAGSKNNPMDQIQGVYGVTILNNMEMVQQRMRRIIEDGASNNPERVQGSLMGREAMDHLASLDGKLGAQPLLDDTTTIEQHLTRYLSDLYTISNRRMDRATGNTWADPVFVCWDGSDNKTGPSLDYYQFLRLLENRSNDNFGDRFARLTERSNALKRFTAARGVMTQLLVGMQPAAIVPKFRARLDQVLTDMERLMEFMETLEKATWINTGVVALVETETAKMMELYIQPRDRSAAVPWLADLLTLRPGIETINEYRGKGKLETTSLEAVITTAAGLNYMSQPKITRGRLMAWFNTFAGMLYERAQLAKTEPVGDYKAMVGRADAAFLQQVQQQMLLLCRTAASRPQSVEEPQALVQLNVLRQRLLELRYVKQIPVWIAAGETAKVQPTFGFARRFKGAAEALGAVDKKNLSDAFDDLNQFNLQFTRYMKLPGEDRLREEVTKQGKSSLPSVGDRGRALLGLIDESRAAWLNNWAKDLRPRPAGRRMFRVALLMRYIAALEGMRNWRHSVEAANSWPAIEVEPKRVEDPIKHSLDALTGAVVRVTDNPDSFTDAELLSYDKIPWSLVVFAELGRQFRNTQGDRQWDTEWYCAELFYQPRETSWVADKREALARLSNAINAGAWQALVFGTATLNPAKMEGNQAAQFLRETDLASERVLSQDEFLNLAP